MGHGNVTTFLRWLSVIHSSQESTDGTWKDRPKYFLRKYLQVGYVPGWKRFLGVQFVTLILRYPGCEINALRFAHPVEFVLQDVVQFLRRAGGWCAECPVHDITSHFGWVPSVLLTSVQITNIRWINRTIPAGMRVFDWRYIGFVECKIN